MFIVLEGLFVWLVFVYYQDEDTTESSKRNTTESSKEDATECRKDDKEEIEADVAQQSDHELNFPEEVRHYTCLTCYVSGPKWLKSLKYRRKITVNH